MKILTNQTHAGCPGLTTIALDGLHEANGLVRAALGDAAFLPKHWDDCMNITRANANYKSRVGMSKDNAGSYLETCLYEIEHGKPELNDKINALAAEYFDAAKLIEPSLTMEQTYRPSEEGELFDAGKIASEDPMAFFAPASNDRPKTGKGDGAFRILINTDVPWYSDPTAQCAALMALVTLLQRSCPVEIWVQQGWWREGCASDGITLFKVFSGGVIQPHQIWFWIGSDKKDNPYSWCVNKMLGRQNARVSFEAEIPCDLYIYGSFMPAIKHERFAEWVANTARPMLFDEELPDGWNGYLTKLPKQK